MAEENNLLNFINYIKAKRPNINNYRNLVQSNNEKYLFKPLEDIPAKKSKKEEKRNGFLVYSQETIKNTKNTDLKNLFKNVNIGNEDNIFRYYYYEELNSISNLHATIIMMNPAFADSKEPDDTIKNIKAYLINNGFSSFDIVNLYPVRMPKSAKLKLYLDKTKDETKAYQAFVKSYLKPDREKDTPENSKQGDKDENIIIAAWGSEYHKKAEKIFKNENIKFYCYGLTKDASPKHFGKQSFCNFNKFLHPIPYIKVSNWLEKLKPVDFDKKMLEKTKKDCALLWTTKGIEEEYIINLIANLEDLKDFLDSYYTDLDV